jgi:hypothetical protein
MLFILSGDVQIGKTRWLESLTDELLSQSVPVAGVLSPGDWRENELQGDGPVIGDDGIERYKLGINVRFLPQGTTIPFARWHGCSDSSTGCTQSRSAHLSWDIDDQAIERVNAFFDSLESSVTDDNYQDMIMASTPKKQGLLVVDELGQLELMRNGGYVSAMHMLEKGPNTCFPHALIVVRSWLLDSAREHFKSAWPDCCVIAPDDDARQTIKVHCGAK